MTPPPRPRAAPRFATYRRGCGRARLRLECARDVFVSMRGQFMGERREQVWVLLLDARRALIGERCVSVGSLMCSIIHPREVFRPAIALSAASLILVHNHPSGSPQPSAEDRDVTSRIVEVGGAVGIPLLDHVIVAADGYFSFCENGGLALDGARAGASG